MRWLWLAALLAVPVAAAAHFVALPAPHAEAPHCGQAACIALQPGEATIRIVQAARYAFRAGDAAILSGAVCGPTMIDVPAGATMVVIEPGAC